MKILIQKAKYAKLFIRENLKEEIYNGFLFFIGIEKGDENKLDKFIEKIKKIKIIENNKGKFKFSLKEKPLPLLIVSQITLIPNFEENKPEFMDSPDKELAKNLYLKCIELLKREGFEVKSGEFGEFMEIEYLNPGPVSFFIKI